MSFEVSHIRNLNNNSSHITSQLNHTHATYNETLQLHMHVVSRASAPIANCQLTEASRHKPSSLICQSRSSPKMHMYMNATNTHNKQHHRHKGIRLYRRYTNK